VTHTDATISTIAGHPEVEIEFARCHARLLSR
jgi:hypothetical protein